MARRRRTKKSDPERAVQRSVAALRSGPVALAGALLLFVALGWSAAQGSGGGVLGTLCRGLASPFRWLLGETALAVPLLLGVLGVLQLVGVTPAKRRPWFVRALLTPFVAAALGGALAFIVQAASPWGGALGRAFAASFDGLLGRFAGGLFGLIIAALVLLVIWGASPWVWHRADHPVGRALRALGAGLRGLRSAPAAAPAVETAPAETTNAGKTPAETAPAPSPAAPAAPAAPETLDPADDPEIVPVVAPLPAPARDEALAPGLLPAAPPQDARVAELTAGLDALGGQVQRVIEETTGVALTPGTEAPTVGLSFVRFTFGKAPGQKRSVRQVDQAAADLGVETGRAPVRVAVTDAIVVELPLAAEERRFAPIRPLLEEVGPGTDGKVRYLLGRHHDGRPFAVDVRQAKHVLVGGATGGGKTVCLHALIFGLVFRHRPSEVRLCLHDPKLVGFHRYAGLPHLWHPVVTTEPELRELEGRLWEELQRRKHALVADPAARFPVIISVLDEFSAPSEVLTRLIAEARAFDLFFVLATQHPRADVVPTPIKANLTTGIAFRVRDPSASRLIVGVSDAAALLPHGDCLVQTPDGLERVQAAWVREEDLTALAVALRPPASEA